MFGRIGKDDFFGDGFGDDPVSRDAASDDPWDFWAHEPTRPIQRIVTRHTPSTPRRRRNRSHGQTEQIRVIELDDTACRPYDEATGLGGQSAAELTDVRFDRERNPLLRRVGAMMVLLSLGAPVAMAMRGGDSGRDDLGLEAAAIAATQATASTAEASVEGQTAASVELTVVTDPATGAVVSVVNTAATAPAETAAAIPAAQPAAVVAPECVKTYEVVADDGWLLIAAKHSVTVDELLASNAANLSTFLMVGATICVPANASAPTTDPPATTTPAVTQPAQPAYVAPFSLPCAKTYTVVLGDGWLRIANKHSVTMKEVLAANAATAGTFLIVGRKICVPANSTTPTVATTTTVKTKKDRPPPEPTLNPPTRTYTPAEVEAIIREIWPDDLEEEALRIAKRESRLNPRAQNYCCWGLFQIYFNVHKKWLAEMGITSGEQLLDPVVAAQAGLRLYQRNGWGPWKL